MDPFRLILLIIILITSLITLFYPIVMSFLWLTGGIIFNRKNKKIILDETLAEKYFEVVVPIYNEGPDIVKHITNNLNLNYSNYRVIAIDDCSTDKTFEYLKILEGKYDNLIIHKMDKNQGKAKVLNYAIDNFITSEYFVCIDSDSILENDALNYLNVKIQKDPKHYAAITGYPNLLNTKNDLIHISQQVEYRSIIGTIKKAQSVFGSIMTVSGVCTAYNTADIKNVGCFDIYNATEDIEITWRLQTSGYKCAFLPEMIIKMYSPDYVYELLMQRKRWTLGGLQTYNKYKWILRKRSNIMLKFFLFEALLSNIWTASFVISSLGLMLMWTLSYPIPTNSNQIVAVFILMFSVSLFYLLVSYFIDKSQKETFGSFLKVVFFFPFIYWFIYPIGYALGFFRFIKTKITKEETGVWRRSKALSPDSFEMRVRYVLSLIFDTLIVTTVYALLRQLLMSYINPHLTTPRQMTIFAFFILLIFMVVFTRFLIYYPLKLGETPGKKLLGITCKSKNDQQINIIQAMSNPIFILFLVLLSSRFAIFNTVVNTLLIGNATEYYYQFAIATDYFTISQFVIAGFAIWFAFDALTFNLLGKMSRTKIIKR